jgi:hypothetical protein
MEQAREGKAREAVEDSDEAAAEVGWEAKVSVWAENAYAPIVATGQLIKEARRATR